jgi:Skp family chaperone for outer membrane proteins
VRTRYGLWVCAGMVLAASIGVSVLLAQNPSGSGVQPLAGQPIYLLDLNYVFENYSKLKVMRQQLQDAAQRAEQVVKERREAIRRMQEELDNFRPGTPDYKKLEEEITKRVADLNVFVAQQRKEFMQQESRDYFTVYQEVMDEVHYFASQNRAALVLRFDRKRVDPEMPDSVVRALNRQVIWNNMGLDITDYILNNLNRRLGVSDSRSRPTVPLAPRQ